MNVVLCLGHVVPPYCLFDFWGGGDNSQMGKMQVSIRERGFDLTWPFTKSTWRRDFCRVVDVKGKRKVHGEVRRSTEAGQQDDIRLVGR